MRQTIESHRDAFVESLMEHKDEEREVERESKSRRRVKKRKSLLFAPLRRWELRGEKLLSSIKNAMKFIQILVAQHSNRTKEKSDSVPVSLTSMRHGEWILHAIEILRLAGIKTSTSGSAPETTLFQRQTLTLPKPERNLRRPESFVALMLRDVEQFKWGYLWKRKKGTSRMSIAEFYI